ncbi:hypothetical protein JCM8097_001129 [Rhodosporidiobolus ruineniae]
MPGDRYRSRSPPPHLSRDSRPAGAGSSRYDDDRRGGDRGGYRDDRDRRRGGYDDRDRRGGGRGGDYGGREERRGGGGGGGGYDGRGGGRGGGRSRSRSPVRRRSRSPPAPAGDGGWGKRREGGEGLADQKELVPGGGGGGREVGEKAPPKNFEPDFKPSGALAAETNTLNGVVLKYAEPPEARKPVRNWRLYVFKGKEQVELFHVHRQSAYLVGRDRIVADIPIDHPSASKQHAVLQFRQVMERNEFGDVKSMTKPFIIDLESANGTLVNDAQIPTSRYYELKTGDVLKFAFSTREYVLLVES